MKKLLKLLIFFIISILTALILFGISKCGILEKPSPVDVTAGSGNLPILPLLVGHGALTTAGSGPNRTGASIIHVTNLNASGAGSLREALLTWGPRIVVFDVSGSIDLTLSGQITITEPFLTIAGQTAPHPGISLKGNGLTILTHDVLVQHITIRVGDDPEGETPEVRDALEIGASLPGAEDGYNVVIDHVSTSWAIDENMSVIYDSTHDILVTNSIISEGLCNSLQTNKGCVANGFLLAQAVTNISIIGNIFAHNDDRNPRSSGDQISLFVNNLVYNWGAGPSVYGGHDGHISATIIGNVYIRGPSTTELFPVKIYDPISPESKIYLQDNLAVETSWNPWSIVRLDNVSTEKKIRVDTPPISLPSLNILKASLVEKSVLKNAGARPAYRDTVDTRIINDILNRTGKIIDSQDEVGGWPVLTENVSIAQVPSNPNEIQPSGYTKVEEWLHGLAKQIEN